MLSAYEGTDIIYNNLRSKYIMRHQRCSKEDDRSILITGILLPKIFNTCSICGKQGYSPTIEEEDFICEPKKIADLQRRAIYVELTKTLKPLPLDSFGRCMDCADMIDK